MQVEDLTKQFTTDFPPMPDEELDAYTLRAREIAAAALSTFQGELLDAAMEIAKATANFGALLEGKAGSQR